MRLKRLLQGTAITALASIAWMGAGKTDVSAKITAGNVKVDTNAQKLVVNPSPTDKEVIISIAKKSKDRKSGKVTFKMTQWDVYETNGEEELKIDLSKLNTVKENFIAIKTEDMETPFIVRIPEAAKVNVITYNAEKNELEFKAGAKKSYAKAAEKFQYRTPYGSWSEPVNLTEGKWTDSGLKKYQYQGLGLYMKTSATKSNEPLVANTSDYNMVYDAKSLETQITVYDAGSFAGKISKLNIAKQAKGPSVPVQYAAGTVTLPKAAEYRVLIGDKDGNYSLKKFESDSSGTSGKEEEKKDETIKQADKSKATKNVRVDTLLGTEEEPATMGAIGILEVRVAKKVNDSKPKKAKCASKWTRVALEVTSPLTDEELGGSARIASATSIVTSEASVGSKYGNGGIRNAIIKKGENTILTVTYGITSKNSDGTLKGTVRFTNVGDDAYQVIAVDGITDIDKLPTTGIKSIPGKGKAASKVFNYTGVKDGSYIYIRKAGNQTSKTWVGVYRLFGRVDFEKDKDISSATSPAAISAK